MLRFWRTAVHGKSRTGCRGHRRTYHGKPCRFSGILRQLPGSFVRAGKRTYHFLDFLWGTPGESIRPAPDFSQRRENRVSLKNKLLREVWGEKVAEHDDYTKLQLIIPPAVKEKMNRKFILVEDVQQVIYFAEKSGNKLLDTTSGHLIAHFQPAIITYWVEYFLENGQYHLYNVYSHRMQIVEDERG